MATKKTVAEIVTERMIKKIETAGNWVKPWQTRNSLNWATKKEYTGINRWLLNGGEYMTFRQAGKLGYSLQKGAPSEMIVRVVVKRYPQGKNLETIANKLRKYSGINGRTTKEVINRALTAGYLQSESDGGYSILNKRLRYYTVFDIAHFNDSEGNKPQSRFATGDVEDVVIDTPENIINNYIKTEGITLRQKATNIASYSPQLDVIEIPPKESFLLKTNIACYYSTFFHEIAHSTGHEKRLNRRFGEKGTDSYAFEELVAELTASMLCHETGVSEYNRKNYDVQEDNTAAYLVGWLRYFESNTSAIIQAASLADKARDYVLKWTNDNIIPDTFEENTQNNGEEY